MTRKPIHAVISEVLVEAGRPMSAREIYEQIQSRGLYDFKAKDPPSIVRGQLRKHCTNVQAPYGARVRYFRMTEEGLFEILGSPQEIAEASG
jgi:hypothetical protein